MVDHPKLCLDTLCVADLACWNAVKVTCLSPSAEVSNPLAKLFGPNGSALTSFTQFSLEQDEQRASFSPLGAFLVHLYRKLAWKSADMHPLVEYFIEAGLVGTGKETLGPINLFG